MTVDAISAEPLALHVAVAGGPRERFERTRALATVAGDLTHGASTAVSPVYLGDLVSGAGRLHKPPRVGESWQLVLEPLVAVLPDDLATVYAPVEVERGILLDRLA